MSEFIVIFLLLTSPLINLIFLPAEMNKFESSVILELFISPLINFTFLFASINKFASSVILVVVFFLKF